VTASALDARPAAAHYERARCLERLGDGRAARREYARASDLDAVPMGAPARLDAEARRIARESGADFVDVAHRLEREAPHRLVGANVFVDHVHPSLAGHQHIARILARGLRRLDVPVARAAWAPSVYRDPPARVLLAARPELLQREYESRMLLHVLLGHDDDARREPVVLAERHPDLAGAADRMRDYLAMTKPAAAPP
jgi:hypothetical protein